MKTTTGLPKSLQEHLIRDFNENPKHWINNIWVTGMFSNNRLKVKILIRNMYFIKKAIESDTRVNLAPWDIYTDLLDCIKLLENRCEYLALLCARREKEKHNK